ncbi:RHS repeat-associated core domain-containing protein [Chryseobacterium sp. CFS15]|nr:RHS repeat-associated core domain-containing protein [Chryseobacterium sp. CFS15]MDQ8142922.1 RHS repeat-associated core domain-containing protein [Chryseobacterium sp. CFS15]
MLEITDANDYYPFGMNHMKTGNAFFGGSYKDYKYNGKELQETGMYDYGARFYMPDIGRWGVVDPLAELDTQWSTYRYAYNNPIRFIDPDGRNEDIYEMDKNGNLEWREDSKTDVIYTSKNFEGEGNDRKLKQSNDGGYEIGEKGYVSKNQHRYNQEGDKYMDFGQNEAEGLEYFNKVGDWMKAGDIESEFGIQTADIGSTDNTVVYTSGNESSVSPVYGGDNVKLDGHLHPGTWSPAQVSGPLNPSGFRMSKFPTKENGYTFKVMNKTNVGDRVSAESAPKAINFIYVPAHNTTIIYNNSQIIKAYEGKFKKD